MDDAAKRLIYERNGVTVPRSTRTGFAGSMSDAEARRIIAARNGIALDADLGRAAALSPEDQALLARMQTNKQARAVLGVIAQVLKQGYEQSVPLYARALSKDSRTLQETMRTRLDSINRYAQKTYAALPDDDAPISPSNRKKVELVLAQARDAVNDITNDVPDSGLAGALTNLLDHVLPKSWGNLPSSTKRVLLYVGLGVVGLVVLGVATRLVRTAMFGKSTALAEAEDAAIAIAQAKSKRRSRYRRVLSIS